MCCSKWHSSIVKFNQSSEVDENRENAKESWEENFVLEIESDGTKKYRCNQCGKIIHGQKWSFKRHFENIHNGGKKSKIEPQNQPTHEGGDWYSSIMEEPEAKKIKQEMIESNEEIENSENTLKIKQSHP